MKWNKILMINPTMMQLYIVEGYESDDGDEIISFLEKVSKASYVPKRKTRKVLTESSVIKESKDQMELGKLFFHAQCFLIWLIA